MFSVKYIVREQQRTVSFLYKRYWNRSRSRFQTFTRKRLLRTRINVNSEESYSWSTNRLEYATLSLNRRKLRGVGDEVRMENHRWNTDVVERKETPLVTGRVSVACSSWRSTRGYDCSNFFCYNLRSSVLFFFSFFIFSFLFVRVS